MFNTGVVISVAVIGSLTSALLHLPIGDAFAVTMIGVIFSVLWVTTPTADP